MLIHRAGLKKLLVCLPQYCNYSKLICLDELIELHSLSSGSVPIAEAVMRQLSHVHDSKWNLTDNASELKVNSHFLSVLLIAADVLDSRK